MVDLKRTDLTVQAERAILIQVYNNTQRDLADTAMDELRDLAHTAHANVVEEVRQTRQNPDPRSYMGSGKVEEVARLCKAHDIEIVICDDDLKPAQVKHLEGHLDTKVVDRSELILDIFAQHAKTQQAKLQVELAQLEYAFPRLKKMWTHLDRLAGGTIGGGIGVRGPGEKQLEVDRRLVQKRISDLKDELEQIEKRHEQEAHDRADRFTTVALVGYTNAGKSTLMNTLTEADVSTEDQLFETLDTRTRQWELPDGRSVMLSDTVGFIRKLPPHLVSSFRATLEEARTADLLLHVCDASAPTAEDQIDSVNEVLDEIGCGDLPMWLILNKTDKLDDSSRLPLLRQKCDHCLTTSALHGDGCDALAGEVQDFLDDSYVELSVETGVGNGRLFSFLYENGVVMERNYEGDHAYFHVKVPENLTGVIKSMGGQTEPIAATTK